VLPDNPEILRQLTRIADALERLANNGKPVEPGFVRPIEEYASFDWDSIGAVVMRSDQDGPTHVEWGGFTWTRRSPQNKFEPSVWYSRSAGKDDNGEVLYLRLISFKPLHDVDPLPRAVAGKASSPSAPVGSGGPSPVTNISKPAHPQISNGNSGKPAEKSVPAQADGEPINASRYYEIALGKRFGMPREYAVNVARYAGVDIRSGKSDFGPAYKLLPYYAEAMSYGLDFEAAADILHECGDDLIRATEALRKQYSGPTGI